MRGKWLAMVLVAVLAGPAGAHGRTVLDPDDSPGPLDVVAARVKHPEGLVKMRLVTYEEWDNATISGDLDFVSFEFDGARPGIDRCVVVQLDATEGSGPTPVRGTVYKDCNAPTPYSHEVGRVIRVTRPDAHGIEIYVDADVLWKKPPESFAWRALTSYEDAGHPGCEPPDPMPPEHFVGTCADPTSWNTHVRP